MKYLAILVLALILAGCSKEVSYSISDAESVGFEKDSQQLYQMVGAIDGWSGTLQGERVELYEFESGSEVNTKAFEKSTQEGNMSGWADLCQVGNLLMISKGKKACATLKDINA